MSADKAIRWWSMMEAIISVVSICLVLAVTLMV